MITAMEKTYCDFFTGYEPIKPTGRYKFVTSEYGNGQSDTIMYIEVYCGWFDWFTRWVSEYWIEFVDIPTVSEEIFTCSTDN